jgi:hypothetical protein
MVKHALLARVMHAPFVAASIHDALERASAVLCSADFCEQQQCLKNCCCFHPPSALNMHCRIALGRYTCMCDGLDCLYVRLALLQLLLLY